MHFWAEAIAFGKWKKVESAGYSEKVRQGDVQIPAQLYKANSDKKTLKYIESLNPQVAARLNGTAAQTAQNASPQTTAKAAPQPAPKVQEQTATRSAAPTENASTAKVRFPHCGTPVTSGSKFCTQCGKPFEVKKKRLRCGAVTDSDSKFCPECGYKLN